MTMKKEQNGGHERLRITPDEYSRIYYEISEADFNTSGPNLQRIDKLARGIYEYLKFKRKHMEGYMYEFKY